MNKKTIMALLVLTLVTGACSDSSSKTDSATVSSDTDTVETNTESNEAEETVEVIQITPSPDKYTWYVKNYVGKNAASFGYTSLGGDRMDSYGSSQLKIIFNTEDGSYLDFSDEDLLKEYVITAQNIEPNTEFKYVFMVDSEGEEFDSLVDSQTLDEIVLAVKKVGDKNTDVKELTSIKTSPDKYTYYIKDYVGRNLANAGYISLGGDLMSSYDNCYVRLIPITDDGSYIELDKEALKDYVVVGQNIAPNSELKITYYTDSDGAEMSITESQNIEEIELNVKKIK